MFDNNFNNFTDIILTDVLNDFLSNHDLNYSDLRAIFTTKKMKIKNTMYTNFFCALIHRLTPSTSSSTE